MRSKILLAIILFILPGRALFAAVAPGIPAITSFSPAQGQVGTLVTIIGTNLNSPTAFSIGGKAAIVVSNTGNQVVGFVMPGAANGIISLTTVNGTANSASTFTVTPPTYPTQQQGGALIGSQSSYYSEQGASVALSADGNTALVGALNDKGGIGATFVYTRSGGAWTQQAELIGTGEVINYGMQGGAVALSADGNTAMIGGRLDGEVSLGTSGFVWFFVRTGTTWTQQGNKIAGTGAVTTGVVYQGASVSLSADGNTAIEGGPKDNGGAGAAWIFTRSNGVWTQVGSKLIGTGGGTGQGAAVAVSADGNTAISGSPGGEGGFYVFTRNGGAWAQQGNKVVGTGTGGQGAALALSADGNTAISGGPGGNGAWVFTRTGGNWTQLGAELTFPGGSAYTGAQEGASVSLSADGNTAIVGGPGSGNNQGGTWIYTRNGSTYTNQGSLILGSGNGFTSSGAQGSGVALSANGTTGLVGAPNNNTYTGLALALSAVLPSVTTNAATAVTSSTANILGSISAPTFSATVNFQYGTDPNLVGATTTTTFSQGSNPVAAGSSNVSFTSSLTGLTGSTTYYFRVNASNINGLTNGAILSFTTPAAPPPPVVITFTSPGTVIYGSLTTPIISSTDKTSPILYRFVTPGIAQLAAGNKFQAIGLGTTYIVAYQYKPGTTTIEAVAQQQISVVPAPLTITADNKTIVWGQPAPTFTATYSGFVNGDTKANLPANALPLLTSPYLTGNAAGGYSIFNGPTATGTGGNYNITYVTGALTVTQLYPQPAVTTQAATTITATGATIHGIVGTNQGPATTVTMQYTTDDIDGLQNLITATLTTGPNTLPGGSGNTNYAAILTGLQPGTKYYFIITGANPEFSVTGSILTFTTPGPSITLAPIPSVVYGSADVTPVATSTNSAIPITYTSSDPTIATITAAGKIHNNKVGTTTITAAQTGTGITPATQIFTVTPAPLVITAAAQSKTYGSPNPALTVTYSTLVNGDTPASLTTQPTITTTATAASAVNTYPITASGAVGPNYSITYANGVLAINPASLVITANNQTKIVGQANPALTVTYTTFVNGDTPDNLTTSPNVTTTATAASGTGTYPITVSGAADINYIITYIAGTLTVNAAFAFNPIPAKIYGDPDFDPGATGTNVTYSSGTTGVATIVAGKIHIVAAGTSVITASSGESSLQQMLVVKPAPLTITAHDQTKTYGAANPAFTVTYSGFVYADNAASLTTQPTATTTATAASPVNTYPITARGAVDANYVITYANGVLTINPASLVITANNQTKIVGHTNPALTVTYTTFVNGDTPGNLTIQPNVTTTATAVSGLGTYLITVSGATDVNYIITYIAGTLTVNPTLVFNPIPAKIYGGPDFAPGATGTNVTYSSGNTGVATITGGGAIHIVGAGSSVITASSGGASIPQTLVVNPAPLTITADNQTKTYGLANPAFTVTYSGFVYTDNAASLIKQPATATTATATSNAGTYSITASGAASPNYTITYVAGVLTVGKAAQTISFAPIPNQKVGEKYDLNGVSASSGLPVSFKLSDAAVASLSGVILTALQPGTETVTAGQAGNENYLQATDVEQTYAVEDTSAAEVIVNQVVSPNGDGIDDILHITGIESYPENKLILINRNGVKIFEMSGYNNTTRVFNGHSNITGVFQQQGTLLYILDYVVKGVAKRKTGFTVLRY